MTVEDGRKYSPMTEIVKLFLARNFFVTYWILTGVDASALEFPHQHSSLPAMNLRNSIRFSRAACDEGDG
jgi:hypothetical protein